MAPGAWDGTLTAEEFERAALHLVSTWERCCPELPQWTWQTSKKTVLSSTPEHACGYLVLQDIRVSSEQKDDVEKIHESDDDDDGGDDVEDHATMYVGSLGVQEQHLYTYHVVYNESYRVPMLFLQGRLEDGRPLQWDSVLRDLPVGSQHVSDQSRWTFLTQEDHPLLHRPWFTLHPCGTNEIMRLVFSDFLLRGKKDTVFVSEQLEELSGISAVSEKQATCESLIGRAEITTSDRSMKWENPEERFASWIENTSHEVVEMESRNRLETSYKRIKSKGPPISLHILASHMLHWKKSGVLYCIFCTARGPLPSLRKFKERHVVTVVTKMENTWRCGHSWRFLSTKSNLPQQFGRRSICSEISSLEFFHFRKPSQDGGS